MFKCWMVHIQAMMMKMQLQRMSNVPDPMNGTNKEEKDQDFTCLVQTKAGKVTLAGLLLHAKTVI